MKPSWALRCFLLLAASSTCAGLALADGTFWKIDPVHTQIHFQVDHQLFSRATGRAHVARGWLRFDPGQLDAAWIDVIIDLTRTDMGDAKWSQAVRSRQFLDTSRHPQSRFTSTAVEPRGDGHFLIHGELSLHGRRLPITLDAHINHIGHDPYRFRRVAGFSATATILRSQFGMQRFRQVVGDQIDLSIEVEAVRARSSEIPGDISNGIEE